MPIIRRKRKETVKTELIKKINDFNLTALIALCGSVTDSNNDKFIGIKATIDSITSFIGSLTLLNGQIPQFDASKLELDEQGISDDLKLRQNKNANYDPNEAFYKLCNTLLPDGPAGVGGERWGTATLIRPNERLMMLDFFQFCSLKHVVDAQHEFVKNSIKSISPEEHYEIKDGSFNEKEAINVPHAVDIPHVLQQAEKLQGQLKTHDTTLLETLLNDESDEQAKLKTAVDLFEDKGGKITDVNVPDGQLLFDHALITPLREIKDYNDNRSKLEKIKTVVATSKAFFTAVNALLTFITNKQEQSDIPHLMMWYIPFLAQGNDNQATCLETTLLDAAETETRKFDNQIKGIALIQSEGDVNAFALHHYVRYINGIIDHFKQQFQHLKTAMCNPGEETCVANFTLDDFDIIQQEDLQAPIAELFSNQRPNKDSIHHKSIEVANGIEFGTEFQGNLLTQNIKLLEIKAIGDTLQQIQVLENEHSGNQHAESRKTQISNQDTFTSFFKQTQDAIASYKSYKTALTSSRQ